MTWSKQSIQWLAGASLLLAALYTGIRTSDSGENLLENPARANPAETSITFARDEADDDGHFRHRVGSHAISKTGPARQTNPASSFPVAATPETPPGSAQTPVPQKEQQNRNIDPKFDLWLEVAPQSPGQQITSDGRRYEVISYQIADAGMAADWIVQISGDENSRSNPTPRHTGGEFSYGFTHEEELFRMKWGWNAFDQVQKDLKAQP